MEDHKLLLICGSKKPAKNEINKKSAARELLNLISLHIQRQNIKLNYIDLRNLDIPFFDGRKSSDYNSEDLFMILHEIALVDHIIISVPAYWGGISGVFKNLLDLIGGPIYDNENSSTPLKGKIIGLLVVGSDDFSAFNAASQLRIILSSMGATVMNSHAIIGNPRNIREPQEFLNQLSAFANNMIEPLKKSDDK